LLKDRGYCIRVEKNMYLDIFSPEGYTIQSKSVLRKHRVICCGCEELQCTSLGILIRLSSNGRGSSVILARIRNERVIFYTVRAGNFDTTEL
uniref:POP4 domain-containing protein n=1 Tax=Steinernema glaseri TaxID=37863 RepID=A0A1I7Y7E9_9BILA